MFNALHPLIIAAAAGLVVALLVLLFAWKARNSTVKVAIVIFTVIALLPVGSVFVALSPWLGDSRFQTYREFYLDVKDGMNREQVFAVMARHYPPDGPRMRPKIMEDTAQRLGFFMNPESSREPNCEGIFLALEGNRVVRKEYSAD